MAHAFEWRRPRCAPSHALLLLSVLLGGRVASGQSDTRYFSREEILSLPRYCQAQKFIYGGTEAPIVTDSETRHWEQVLGPGYVHFHHYCWALMKIRRAANASDAQTRAGLYRQAIDDLDYVQRNTTAAFPLAPEVAIRKGMTLQLVGDDGSATREFMRSIRLKSDYTPGYAALVDQYVRLGLLEEARKVLQEGLRHAPASRLLLQRQLELESGKQD